MRKITYFLCAATIAASATNFSGCTTKDFPINGENVKNVILFIGDGMGENHIENALTYFELETPVFFADRKGSLHTQSANNLVTDSAAAATALATGKKVNNREISRHNGEDIETISELAKRAGKKVGVITTDTLDGATPSAFSSHADDRGDSEDIAKAQAASGIDLFIGQTGSDTYATKYSPFFTENGYTFAQSAEEMLTLSNSEKLIATIPDVRSEYNDGHENAYQLKSMAAFAMEFLENENGYFLMIESAYIDKYSHNNELISALCEVRSLFDCMDYFYSVIGDDTALLLTADHETGWLQKATDKSDITNDLYLSGGHTMTDVPLYVKNFSFTYESTPQNTAVFEMCKTLLKIK